MAYGDIIKTQIIDHRFDTTDGAYACKYFSICRISSTYYAVTYRGDDNYGYLKTFNISNDGSSVTLVDSWTYENTIVYNTVIKKTNLNYYSIWGSNASGFGSVFTCEISNTGIITKSVIDSLQYEASRVDSVSVIHIPNTDYYLCAYRASSDSGFHIDCIDISGSVIGNMIDSIDFGVDTVGFSNSIIYLENGMVACTYRNDVNEGHLITFTINLTTGALSAILANETMSSHLWYSEVCKPHRDIQNLITFVISGADSDGHIHTIEVDTTTGAISLLHNTEFESVFCSRPNITQVSYNGAVMIGWRGNSVTYPNTEGKISTFQIGVDGSISLIDSWDVGTSAGSAYEIFYEVQWQQIGSNTWICLCAETTDAHGHIFTFITYSDGIDIDEPEVRPASCALLAPVNAIPTLTNARNTSGYNSGREPKYTLDNDPDTWWEPDQFTTSTLYFDLGQTVSVDAIVMWLHNYNENYVNDKSWHVSYSTDDVTYSSIQTHVFADDHTAYSPLVVDKFNEAVSARYWRIQFLYFADVPQTIIPEISCVWFMDDYSLLWKHQRPEINRLLYHNNEIITRSGHRFTSPAGIGKQRIIQRQFIFVDSTNQWTNLKGAYDAARGCNLPIVMQSEFNSNEYFALRFEKPLIENRQEHDTWTPQITLRELGHMRVTYQNKSLIQPHHNSAVYHFRNNAIDSGFNKRDWTENETPMYTADGIAEQGTTVINLSGTVDLSISTGDASWADMGSDSFTIECWFRGVDDVLLCRKASDNYDLTDAGFFMGIYNRKLCLSISDGSDFPSLSPSPSPSPEASPSLATATLNDFSDIITGTDVGHSKNQWHYVVMVVDRTGNLMHGYVDGGDHLQVDISSITGSISRPDQALLCGSLDKVELFIDGLTISPGYVMSAQEVANRYLGRIDYGSWGM